MKIQFFAPPPAFKMLLFGKIAAPFYDRSFILQ